jgi:hypothetical protein
MTGHLLLRGMLVGLLAGLLAFGFARVFGEPQVERAIAFESLSGHTHSHEPAPAAAPPHSHDHGAEHSHDDGEMFTRATQAGIGLFTGVIVYGAAVGGLFALAFAFAHGRLGRMGPRGTAAFLALAAFVALALVPWLKYPANPPSVGAAETIGQRTALYFGFVLVSLAAAILSIWLGRIWRVRLGGWNAALAAAAVFVLVTGLVAYLMPGFDEVPEHFSGTLLWRFRLASLGIQLVLWTALGLGFGALTERSLGVPRSSAATRFSHRPV